VAHPGVLGEHLGDERPDALAVRHDRQLLEQQRTQALGLVPVRHEQGDLRQRAVRRLRDEVADGDEVAVDQRRDGRPRPVRPQQLLDVPLARALAHGEVAQPARSGRHRGVQRPQGGLVLRHDGAQLRDPPVAQEDVGDGGLVPDVPGGGHPLPCASGDSTHPAAGALCSSTSRSVRVGRSSRTASACTSCSSPGVGRTGRPARRRGWPPPARLARDLRPVLPTRADTAEGSPGPPSRLRGPEVARAGALTRPASG
jgi:hypothetical protein